MDDCFGTLAFIGVLFAIAGIVVALLKRAERRREEERRAREHAQWQAAQAHSLAMWQQQQAHTQWQHQQQLAREAQARQARYTELTARFGAENAARIMRGEFWQGQTEEMLVSSLGLPDDTDERVLKTKTRHVYKYYPTGKNRYRLRITLENGVVVGWEDKS